MYNELCDVINRIEAIKSHPTTDSWEREQLTAALDRLNSVKIGKRYVIVDLVTNQRVGGPYSCRQRARNRANKLDLEYGAYRYTVVEVS